MSNWLFFALLVKLVPNVSKAFFFLSLTFLSTLTFFLSEDDSCAPSAFSPNILEKIEPNGIALNCGVGLSSKLVESSDVKLEGSILDKSILFAISFTIVSSCLVMSFKSFSDKLACFIKLSIGFIPLAFAHS